MSWPAIGSRGVDRLAPFEFGDQLGVPPQVKVGVDLVSTPTAGSSSRRRISPWAKSSNAISASGGPRHSPRASPASRVPVPDHPPGGHDGRPGTARRTPRRPTRPRDVQEIAAADGPQPRPVLPVQRRQRPPQSQHPHLQPLGRSVASDPRRHRSPHRPTPRDSRSAKETRANFTCCGRQERADARPPKPRSAQHAKSRHAPRPSCGNATTNPSPSVQLGPDPGSAPTTKRAANGPTLIARRACGL